MESHGCKKKSNKFKPYHNRLKKYKKYICFVIKIHKYFSRAVFNSVPQVDSYILRNVNYDFVML